MSTPTPAAPRAEVAPPPLEPYSYGLLSVARVMSGEGRWQVGGVEYPTDACAQGGSVPGSCPVPEGGGEERTAVLTATPGGGDGTGGYGVLVVPAAPDSTTGVVLVADEHLPGPVDVEVVPPGELGLMRMQLQPGQRHELATPADGLWRLTVAAGDCPEVGWEVPYATGQEALAGCLTIAYPVVWSSAADSETAVTYEVHDAGTQEVVDRGTVAPGETRPPVVYPSPASYELTFRIPGAGNTVEGQLSLPGGTLTQDLLLVTPAGSSHDKPVGGGLDWVTGAPPFTVYSRAECNRVGFPEAAAVAESRLRLIEEREVEKAFSLYLGTLTHRLPLGEDPVPLLVALGALEQDAALHYAGAPTLHAPRWTQPAWTRLSLVEPAGPMMRTALTSRVAFGGGYYDDPRAPLPPAPASGEFWLIATGTVTARRSSPFTREAFDPPTNRALAISERTYALDHDCYTAAVLVSLGGTP